MPIINFKCKKCSKEFDYDVGRIDFQLVNCRPQFEREIRCDKCGILTLDDVELTELGQFQLTELYIADRK